MGKWSHTVVFSACMVVLRSNTEVLRANEGVLRENTGNFGKIKQIQGGTLKAISGVCKAKHTGIEQKSNVIYGKYREMYGK